MRSTLRLLAAAAAISAGSLASAASVPFSGTFTTSDPTFARPTGGTPPTTTAVGAYYYDVYPFFVNAAATYSLETLSANLSPSAFGPDDTFIVLYQTSFNPASPLTNALVADDDGAATGFLSLITRPLVPGVQYFLVTTAFTAGALGPYTGSISAPGAATAVFGLVPEPSTYLMMLTALGVGGIVAARRKKA